MITPGSSESRRPLARPVPTDDESQPIDTGKDLECAPVIDALGSSGISDPRQNVAAEANIEKKRSGSKSRCANRFRFPRLELRPAVVLEPDGRRLLADRVVDLLVERARRAAAGGDLLADEGVAILR